jgi:hypothetical protein
MSWNIKLFYPLSKEFYPQIGDYLQQIRNAVIHLSIYEQFDRIQKYLGEHFASFFELYRSEVICSILTLDIILDHLRMEMRRLKQHLSYSKRKDYKRLHSITKFCDCGLCRSLFKSLNLDWNAILAHPKNKGHSKSSHVAHVSGLSDMALQQFNEHAVYGFQYSNNPTSSSSATKFQYFADL